MEHATEVLYNSEEKRYYFVIRNENGMLLFQSGEWNTEKECSAGITGFMELLQTGCFDANCLPQKLNDQFYISFVSDQDEIWGRSPLEKTYEESLADYHSLKRLLAGENNITSKNSIPLDPRIIDFLYSLDGAGYKNPEMNPTNERQWEIAWESRISFNETGNLTEMRQFELWKNETLQNSFTKQYFKELPKSKQTDDQSEEQT